MSVAFEAEKKLPVRYDGSKMDMGYLVDLIVESKVIVEVNRRRAKQFGLDLGTYAIGASFSPEVDPRGGTATVGGAAGDCAKPNPR